MRKAIGIASFVVLVGSILFAPATVAAPGDSSKPSYRVFVFHAGASAAVADAGTAAIRRAGKDGGFAVEASADADRFTANQLSRFRVVVFLGTSGNVLNDAQQTAFEDWFHAGGGFLGIGSAIETEADWTFLTDVLGTRSSGRLASVAGSCGRSPNGSRSAGTSSRAWRPSTTASRSSRAGSTST